MTPAGLSIREAARLFAVSRPTLAKWISMGKISAAKGNNGDWLINPSEMIRLRINARPQAEAEAATLPRPIMDKLSTIAAPKVDNTSQEIETLRARLAEAEQRAAVAEAQALERAARIEDLRRMLLLTDQRGQPNAAQEPAAGRSWWSRMIGRQ